MPAREELLDRRFDAVVLDWDGTVVPSRAADGGPARRRIEALSSAGVHVVVVTGTNVDNVDRQLRARPSGAGGLHLCCNRGSEVFEVTGSGPELLSRRVATSDEDAALDRSAAAALAALEDRGLHASVVSARRNRRKIDLIPQPRWADPKKAELAELTDAVMDRLHGAGFADLEEVVALARAAAREAGLEDPRVTSDVKHVEIGLTDKSDSAVWAAGRLAAEGVTGGLVLLAGDEFGPAGGTPGSDSLLLVEAFERATAVSVGVEPWGVPEGVLHVGGGPGACLALLDAQLARRRDRRVPDIDPDPRWVLPLPGSPVALRVGESLGTVANGWTGTRGSLEEDGPGAVPLLVANGVYTEAGALVPGPDWTRVDRPRRDRRRTVRRWLDLRSGLLLRDDGVDGALRSLRFACAAPPYALAMRVERADGGDGPLDGGEPLRPPGAGGAYVVSSDGDTLVATTTGGGACLAAAARDETVGTGARRVLERLVGWGAGRDPTGCRSSARERLDAATSSGFDGLLAAHRARWARRWAEVGIAIEGDPACELATRFAVLHLLAASGDTPEAAVGARGLTGEAYAGHVFWDADVFVLPALVVLDPGSARSMLEYRVTRLPAALELAASLGRRGARFPWESAGDGRDVTPRLATGPDGTPVTITTGELEEHIVADVAWAADHYAAWTADPGWLDDGGRDLVVETARYWASRVRTAADGTVHLDRVTGPDEYHTAVDDNAYTNVMARRNLRRAAGLLHAAGGSAATTEAAALAVLADRIVDGFDPALGLYEQFAGYFALEPLLVDQVGTAPLSPDVVLGRERVEHSQLIKQADVLMLHHLVPDEVVPGSLDPCLDFYGPRTTQGSSLSPAIQASLLARAGRPDEALAPFRLAARLDLDDVTGTTAGGLHLATLGGVVQALVAGFAGLAPTAGGLAVDPRLPAAWDALDLGVHLGGRLVRVRSEHDRVTIACDGPLDVSVAGRAPVRCTGPVTVLPLPSREHRRCEP